jgi:hypothetical protein
MKGALTARLAADMAIASQMKPNCVWVYLSELPPNQMVEFGRVLPSRKGSGMVGGAPGRRESKPGEDWLVEKLPFSLRT